MKLSLKGCKTVSTIFVVILALTVSAGMARGQGAGAPGAGGPGAGGPGGAARGPRPLTVHPLHDGVYWTDGGTGVSNSGIIVGTDGVVLFDPKGTLDAAKDVITEVGKITDKPITTVIISHPHPDHTRGLPSYPNVNIIAQREAARQIEMETFYYTWSASSAGDATGLDKPYVPTQVVDRRAAVKINGVNFVLLHWAPSHTSGDLVAYLPDQKIAFIGDMGIGGRFENGGSVAGSIEAMRGLLALDCDTFVSGHAPVRTKDQMQKAFDDGLAKYNKIVAMWEEGKSLEDAEQAMGDKVIPRPQPVIPGLAVYRPGRNMDMTEEVYEELSRR